jgi:type I restriction enzyme, S subunit
VRLGDLAEHRLGKMLDKAKNTGVPRRYLRNPNVRWFDVDLSDLQEILVEERDVHKYELRYGDVIICEGGEAGRAALWKDEAEGIIFQKAIHRVRVGPKLDARFLIHRLMFDYFNGGLDDYYTGATIKHFTGQDLARYEIPLPPLNEQRRIAAILDKADELRRKRKRAVDLLDSLAQSIFKNIESEPDWPRVPFGEAVYYQEGPGIRNWQFRDSGIKLVNVRNIVNGVLNTENTSRFLSEEEVTNRYQHFLLEAGDFVLASSGVTWGKIAEVKKSDLPICLNTSMIRIRPRAPFSKAYVRSFIEFGDFRSQINRLITGSAQPNFGPSHLKQVLIPKMPVDLQDTLEQLSIKMGSVRKTSATTVDVSDVLFSSLQSRAFAGQL